MSNRVPIESKIYLISGKGGVGKSSVAAALGQNFAKKGLRTLIVELGENSYFNYLFAKNFSFEPQSIGSNLDLATWSGENCLKEFIAYYIRLTKIVDLFFENKIMKTLVKAAPALHELAILGKLTSGPRKIGPELRYDRIVLDGFSSGHFLSLLRVPRGMAEAIPLGPMGQQSQKIHDILINSDICKYIWVSTTEELPVQESLEFTDQLKNEFNIQPQIVLNKVISQELPDSIEKMQSHFAKYLIKLKMREQWAFTQLSNHHQVVKVPLSFYGNFQEKLDQLAGVFSSHAQFV